MGFISAFKGLTRRIKYITDEQIYFNFLDVNLLHFCNQRGGFFDNKIKMTKIPYILVSNPNPDLIRTSFCRFLKRKKVSPRF